MKKMLSFVLASAMVLAMVGCGSTTTTTTESSSAAAESTVAATETTTESVAETTSETALTTLKVGMEIGYPPFEYYDADGTTVVGVDVELANALAEKMGVDVELVDTAWDGIFAGLDKGDYDCIISAVTITSDRLLDYDFSDPYIQNYQCIVTKKDAAVKPATPEECDGLTVGYQEETTSDIFMTDLIASEGLNIETAEYAKVIDVFNDLENGRLDAVICDSTVASSYLGEDSDYEQTWIQDTEPEEFGICIKQGNSELTEQINTALQELKDDGTLDAILAKYF